MAGLTSQGIGSGLDVASLVAKLVAAEKAPRQNQITRAQTSAVSTISALASLKGAMASFNDSLTSLSTESAFATRSATSSQPAVFTASATTAAVPGTYDVQVDQLAASHQIASNAFASGASQVVGTGTLTIAVGARNFSISADSSHNTLAQIRDAINQATGNDDIVRATIVNASDGAHLVLSAQDAGDDNQIVVSQADGDGGLASLVYNPSLTTNYDEVRAGHDAVIFVAGFEHRSTTNNFSDAIDGVSITLLSEDEVGETRTLTIADDASATTARIRTFVEKYNELQQQIAALRSYEPETKRAGPLLGDAMLRGIETDLRSKLTNAVSGLAGNYQSLASVGITTQKDGSLKLDNAKVSAALAADYEGIARLFGSEGGVAARLSESLDRHLATDAQLEMRTKALNARSVALQKDQANLETRMAEIQKRYNAQFNALDSLLSTLQSQSTFLTQQLSSIAKIGSGGD